MSQEQTNSTIFENGATWLRADFHLHTHKDKEFKNLENPNDFFNQSIRRLKEEQIHIAVVTNHNKFDKDEYLNFKKRAIKEDIWILPGIELSVNDGANGIHCLIVFERASWIDGQEDYINQFLTSAFEGVANRENENTRCNYSLENVLQKLSYHKTQGRDSFIIMAHVDLTIDLLSPVAWIMMMMMGGNIPKTATQSHQHPHQVDGVLD